MVVVVPASDSCPSPMGIDSNLIPTDGGICQQEHIVEEDNDDDGQKSTILVAGYGHRSAPMPKPKNTKSKDIGQDIYSPQSNKASPLIQKHNNMPNCFI